MHNIFETKHLILLAVCAILITAGTLATKEWSLEKLCKTLFYIGIVAEFIKIFNYILANEAQWGGVLPKEDLPFHLCSIQLLLVAVVVAGKSQKLKDMILSFMMPGCLLGAAAALLLPTEPSLNGSAAITLEYFGYHSVLVIFGLRLLLGKLDMSVKSYVNCLKFLGIIFFFAIYINSILYDGVSDINFMYVASPPMEGLPYLNEEHGWLVYIVHYAALVLLCITLCYCKPLAGALRARFSRTKEPA